jgi:hypothetical protein
MGPFDDVGPGFRRQHLSTRLLPFHVSRDTPLTAIRTVFPGHCAFGKAKENGTAVQTYRPLLPLLTEWGGVPRVSAAMSRDLKESLSGTACWQLGDATR